MNPVRLMVDLSRISRNARLIRELCEDAGLAVIGVTKAVAGNPEIARAMITGGIEKLADSRLDNIARLRDGGINTFVSLIRAPSVGEVRRCVELADESYSCAPETLRALSQAAIEVGCQHEVVLMVDLETGREGCRPEEVSDLCRFVDSLPAIKLNGIGVYFDFYSESGFHLRKLRELVALAQRAERETGLALPVVSGGSTNVLDTVVRAGNRVSGVSDLRIGTTILLGIYSSIGPKVLEGCRHDSCVLEVEIIEIQHRDESTFGLLAMGTLDVDPDYIFPVIPELKIIHATSDQTVVDLSCFDRPPRVGDRLEFLLGYYALARLACSRYTEIVCT